MIISASRRTDIPAFFGDWFMERVRQGFFLRINPFNTRQVSTVSIKPQEVDLFVFWTKNPQPFLPHLAELDAMGYRYYFQYTLNDYPSIFEPHLPPVADRIEVFKQLSVRIGPRRVVWRYDPIIISSLTPEDYHLDRLQRLAQQLNGHAERQVISFCDSYGHAGRRLTKLSQEHRITFEDPIGDPQRLTDLARGIKSVADAHSLSVSTCAEAVDLASIGILPGACIDAKLINELFHLHCSSRKDPHQRPECGCVAAIDMGMYNTCSHGCVYCYANHNEKTIANNLRHHDQRSGALIGRPSREQ